MSNPFTSRGSTEPPKPATIEAIDAEFEDITSDVTLPITPLNPPRAAILREQLGLLDENEVADALGLQARTLKSWRTDKTGPAYVKAGKSVFYLFDDVRSWLRSVRVTTSETTQTPPKEVGESNDAEPTVSNAVPDSNTDPT